MFDDASRAILRHLQSDPSLTVPELSERARLSTAQVIRRLDKLTEDGVIKGQVVKIDWQALGYEVHVSLRITLDKSANRAFEEFLEATKGISQILEVQSFLGRVDVRLSLVARDLQHYQRIYREQILGLPHIADIEALMTVGTVKRVEALPL